MCCCDFRQKIRKTSCVDFSENLKNLILGPDTSKQTFSQVSCVDFLQYLKNLILSPVRAPFDPKTSKQEIFKKSYIRSILSLYATVNFYCNCKFWASIFHITRKTSFWVHFGLFWFKNLKTRFFPNKDNNK